jgi:hypothetical protein
MILKRSSLMYLSFPTDIRLTSSWRTHETWNKRNLKKKNLMPIIAQISAQDWYRYRSCLPNKACINVSTNGQKSDYQNLIQDLWVKWMQIISPGLKLLSLTVHTVHMDKNLHPKGGFFSESPDAFVISSHKWTFYFSELENLNFWKF